MDLISDVRGFLTPDKKRRKNIHIIDADNIQSNIGALLANKKTAMVICFSSSDIVTQGIYNQLSEKPKNQNKLYIYSVDPGKDATDIFMASVLGWLIAKYGRDYNYYLMSNDKIFEVLRHEYEKLGYDIKMFNEN